MTDFDTEMLNEKEPCVLLSGEKDPACMQPGPAAAGNAALAEAAREPDEDRTPERLRKPEDEPASKPAPAPDPRTATEEEPATERLPQAGQQAEALRSGTESEAQRQVAARRRMLTHALAMLLRDPEAAPLASLMEAFRGASEAEAEQAAAAITTLYLRAEAEERRRLRPVLSEAIRRAQDTGFAKALQARLGAIAVPRTPPATPVKEPEP